MCNRTQNDAIWRLIALFLANQIAGNTIDFKMNLITNVTSDLQSKNAYVYTVGYLICPLGEIHCLLTSWFLDELNKFDEVNHELIYSS